MNEGFTPAQLDALRELADTYSTGRALARWTARAIVVLGALGCALTGFLALRGH